MAAPAKPNDGIGALVATLTNKWDAKTVESFARSLENRDAAETDATTAAFQTLDTKAYGLLTHVSMMIAGLGICAPLLAQHRIEEMVIVGEIVVYLIIAIGCLRCLSVVRTLADVEKMVAAGANRIGASAGVSIMQEFLKKAPAAPKSVTDESY